MGGYKIMLFTKKKLIKGHELMNEILALLDKHGPLRREQIATFLRLKYDFTDISLHYCLRTLKHKKRVTTLVDLRNANRRFYVKL